MRDALRILRRFLPGNQKYLVINVIANFLMAIFNVFSLITLIPILKILFRLDTNEYVHQSANFEWFPPKIPRDAIMNNLYAYVSDLMNTNGPEKVLIYVSVFGIIMVLFKTGFSFLSAFCMVKMRNRIVLKIRNNIYSKVLSLPLGYFNDQKKGDIISRSTSDITEIEVAVDSPIEILFRSPIMILLSILAMVFLSWELTLFVLIMFPISGGIIGVVGKSLRKKSMKGQTKMGEILSTIEETLSGLRIVKAFNAESKMEERQSRQNREYKRIMDNLLIRNSLASPLSEFLGTVMIIAVTIFGGTLILKSQLSPESAKTILEPGEFLVYIVFFYSVINPTKSFSTAYYRVQKALASIERVDQVLNAKSNIIVKPESHSLSDFNEEIEFKDVWFKYQEDFVLKEINIKVKKNQSVALVGRSGSGKSTMADLIPRFYDVTQGAILIDGFNIRDCEPKSIRDLIGIVNQEPILFNDTIYNNIAFGVKDTTPEEVERASKIANAHEFIMETEKGYQTSIGDRGGRLSGGQRQRISIARAILTNAPIMILDEATSSLDTESERLVQNAINNMMTNRTSIVIAHRLSTIKNVDKIYVVSDGKIIEEGTYKELLMNQKEFKTLHDNQFN